MDWLSPIEIVGYIASVALCASYAFRDTRRMRLANALGCVLFVVYGILLARPAIVILNGTCFVLQLSYLLLPNFMERLFLCHAKKAIAGFVVYCICVLGWFLVAFPMDIVELLGVVSSLGIICGWMLPDELRMRSVCAIATVVNLVYAVLIVSVPMCVSNSVALTVNLYRLYGLYRSSSPSSCSVDES